MFLNMKIITFENVKKRLPELRNSLGKISTEWNYQQKEIGEAISYLSLLEDLIDNIEEFSNE